MLQQPGTIPTRAQRFLPDPCSSPSQCKGSMRATEHAHGEMFYGNYYIRLLDPSQEVVSLAGLKPPGFISSSSASQWQLLKDRDKNRYRQITLPLRNPNKQLWGYLQVGSSLKDSDRYLYSVRLALFTGFPLALSFIGIASWWLAGRAMRPIRQSFHQIQQFTADAAQ